MTYARVPLGTEKSEVDHVLAIKDVYPHLLSRMKQVGEDPRDLSTSGKIGISWGRSGGEAGGLFTESYLAADGIENVIRVLEDLEDEKFTNLKFVELNACNGGCVGGVLTVENPYVAEVKLKHLRKYMPVARSHMDMEDTIEDMVPWTTSVEYEPVFSLGDNMMESFRTDICGLRFLRGPYLQGPGRGHCPGRGQGKGLCVLSAGESPQAVGRGVHSGRGSVCRQYGRPGDHADIQGLYPADLPGDLQTGCKG